jgi:2-oxoglutarate ferredoxin oxidoreductase subunit delta
MSESKTAVKPKKERKVKGKIEIDIEKCKGCELCSVVCKEDALVLSKNLNNKGYRYIVAINDNCTGCVNCALVCPDAVIKVWRTNPKKRKELIAQISNVTESISFSIDNPILQDLQKMEYI